MITRQNAAPLIPVERSREIIQEIGKRSVVMQMMRQLPNMTSNQRSIPVLATLPITDFTGGDYGLKKETEQSWDNVMLTAGEIAGLVAIPDAVLADSDYDLWQQIGPALYENAANLFDRNVLAVRSALAPSDWPDPIIPAAIAAGHEVFLGSGTLIQDISNTLGTVEADGYDITGVLSALAMKKHLREVTTTGGQPLWQPMTDTSPDRIYGYGTNFVGNATLDAANDALMIVGDWTKGVFAIREDMELTPSNTAVLTDANGKVTLNAYQQDCTIMRFRWRVAWALPQAVSIDRPTIDPTVYPFGVLTMPAGGEG